MGQCLFLLLKICRILFTCFNENYINLLASSLQEPLPVHMYQTKHQPLKSSSFLHKNLNQLQNSQTSTPSQSNLQFNQFQSKQNSIIFNFIIKLNKNSVPVTIIPKRMKKENAINEKKSNLIAGKKM